MGARAARLAAAAEGLVVFGGSRSPSTTNSSRLPEDRVRSLRPAVRTANGFAACAPSRSLYQTSKHIFFALNKPNLARRPSLLVASLDECQRCLGIDAVSVRHPAHVVTTSKLSAPTNSSWPQRPNCPEAAWSQHAVGDRPRSGAEGSNGRLV